MINFTPQEKLLIVQTRELNLYNRRLGYPTEPSGKQALYFALERKLVNGEKIEATAHRKLLGLPWNAKADS